MTRLRLPLATWRHRIGFGLGLPVGVWFVLVVLLKLADPVEFLECRREVAGAPVICEHRFESWRPDPPPERFVLDGARLELRDVSSSSRRGRSTRSQLVIQPVEGEAVTVDVGGARGQAELRRMQDDPGILAFARDDDAFAALWFGLPVMVLVTAIPLLALGGRLDVDVRPAEVSFTRVRAWWLESAPIVLPRDGLTVRARRGTGRRQTYGAVVAHVGGREVVIVREATLGLVEAAAQRVAAALTGPGARDPSS
jgi:hypothetical protein